LTFDGSAGSGKIDGMLTSDEIERYDRQIIIQDFGIQGQEKLKKTKVLIAGAGGLGSTAAIYLTAAGIGSIRIVDHDQVELSNLNRQILHWTEDINKKKVDSAVVKLNRLNPGVKTETVCETITAANAARIVNGCDLIVDAMDNLPTRLILNQTALKCNMPFFYGAVNGLEGRVMTIIPGETACLRCLYRGPIAQQKFPVIGTTPALVGSIQATEVLKYILRMGSLLTNRLLIFDGLRLKFTEFMIKKNPLCEHCGQSTEKG
jgi:adenylyltransferase/sulfurtransferase